MTVPDATRPADDAGTPTVAGDDGDAATEAATDSSGARLEADVERLRRRLPDRPLWYVWLLLGVGAVDGAANTVLTTVFEDIKLEFGVSDSTLGGLVAAYSVAAALSVIPFGYLADRWRRVRLIAIGFIPWGIAMMLTGAATSFGMMFAARLLLGAIEATNGPATPSLLGDYYPVGRRGRLFGVIRLGSLVGSLVGIALAGVISSMFGWRMAFFVWGAVGFACGALVLKLLPEPTRGIPDALDRAERRLAEHTGDVEQARGTPAAEEVRLDEVAVEISPDEARPPTTHDYRTISTRAAVREIFKIRTMWIMFAAGTANDFFMAGISTWAVTFFRRHHELSAMGGAMAVFFGAIGIAGGVVVGARLADRAYLAGHPEMRIKLSVIGAIGAGVFFTPAFAVDSLALSFGLFWVAGFFFGLPWAPESAVSVDILVPRLRGRAMALRSLLRIGMIAVAPILFGVMSDAWGLQTAFVVLSPTMVVQGLVVSFAIRTYRRDLAFAQAESQRQIELEEADDAGAAAARPPVV